MTYYYSGEYDLYPCGLNYEPLLTQPYISHSTFDFHGQTCNGYYSNPYFNHPNNGSSLNCFNFQYCQTTFAEPKSIQYYTDPSVTQLVISYSTTEFNEPSFEEYDPTPYDGGYDIAQTYGKPLPPSEETCYPRSTPADPNALVSSDGVSSGSIPLPKLENPVQEQEIKPSNASPEQVTEEEKHTLNGVRDGQDEEEIEEAYSDESDDSHTGAGYGGGFNNEYSEDKGSEYEKQEAPKPQIPSGYGLEALDLCESLFGWPCLTSMKRRVNRCQEQEVVEEDHDMWKGTADYLFGSLYPYGGREDGQSSYRDPIYAYERHYPSVPSQYWQVECEEKSWQNWKRW